MELQPGSGGIAENVIAKSYVRFKKEKKNPNISLVTCSNLKLYSDFHQPLAGVNGGSWLESTAVTADYAFLNLAAK